MNFRLVIFSAALAAAALLAHGAAAQTNTAAEPPYVYAATVGTSPVQVVPQLANRRSIEFCNPNAAITLAVCPVRNRTTGAAIVCALNDAGSITLPPSVCWSKSVQPNQPGLSTAWNAVASAASGKISVFETQ